MATKVTVNQIVFTPLFNSYFFGMQSVLSGDGFISAWERIKRTVPTSFLNSLKLWPAVTAFNFTYISPQYRALFAGQSHSLYSSRVGKIDIIDRCDSRGLAVVSFLAESTGCT